MENVTNELKAMRRDLEYVIIQLNILYARHSEDINPDMIDCYTHDLSLVNTMINKAIHHCYRSLNGFYNANRGDTLEHDLWSYLRFFDKSWLSYDERPLTFETYEKTYYLFDVFGVKKRFIDFKNQYQSLATKCEFENSNDCYQWLDNVIDYFTTHKRNEVLNDE